MICSRLLDEEEVKGSISLRNFYLRRLFRIQPAAIVYLLAVALLAAVGIVGFNSTGWWMAFFSVRNLYRAADVSAGGFYTAHFWSLALEEHFYLVMPWLLVLLRGRHRLAWFSLLTGISLLLNDVLERAAFAKRPLSSELELCWLFLAAWFALLLRRPAAKVWLTRHLPAIPVVAAACVIAWGVARKWKFVWHLWFPLFPLLILATVLHPKSIPSRILEWKPLRMIGRISFSLYLWQQLFCLTLWNVPYAKWPFGWLQHLPQSLAVPFLFAFASYFLVEKPFLKIGHRLATRYVATSKLIKTQQSESRI